MSTIFDENDDRLLAKTLSVRERLIDNLLKVDLPTKDRDLVAFTNLLESVDRSIFQKTKLKLDKESQESQNDDRELLRSLLVELHKEKKESAKESLREDIPQYTPQGLAIRKEELLVGKDEIDPDTILDKM
jgi:hypothetical protein